MIRRNSELNEPRERRYVRAEVLSEEDIVCGALLKQISFLETVFSFQGVSHFITADDNIFAQRYSESIGNFHAAHLEFAEYVSQLRDSEDKGLNFDSLSSILGRSTDISLSIDKLMSAQLAVRAKIKINKHASRILMIADIIGTPQWCDLRNHVMEVDTNISGAISALNEINADQGIFSD